MPADEVLITKVAPRAVEVQRDEHLTSFSREPIEPFELPKEPNDYSLTLWQKMRLMPFVFQLFRGIVMKDIKTTITAIVGAAAYVCNALFGIGIPQEAIIAVTVFVLGLFAGDSKNSEG